MKELVLQLLEGQPVWTVPNGMRWRYLPATDQHVAGFELVFTLDQPWREATDQLNQAIEEALK